MIFKFSYIKHNKFGRKGTINNNIDKTGFIYIKGYENLYMINNEGIIISCSKISGNVVLKDRYLKYTTKENGYLQVHLTKNGKRGSDAGIIYAINNNSLYKRKYKIKIISYGKR